MLREIPRGWGKVEAERAESESNIRAPASGALLPAMPPFPVAMLKCGMTGGQVKGGAAVLALLLRRRKV